MESLDSLGRVVERSIDAIGYKCAAYTPWRVVPFVYRWRVCMGRAESCRSWFDCRVRRKGARTADDDDDDDDPPRRREITIDFREGLIASKQKTRRKEKEVVVRKERRQSALVFAEFNWKKGFCDDATHLTGRERKRLPFPTSLFRRVFVYDDRDWKHQFSSSMTDFISAFLRFYFCPRP